MFIGHFGVGFASKKIEPMPSLGTLFIAAQFIDLLWPLFILLGIERVVVEPGNTVVTPLNFIYYPFSHSLVSVLFWSILLGVTYFIIKKNIKASVILALLVVSHWFLDFITHIPDLPLAPWGNTKVGLGLWNSLALTLLVEGAIFIGGIFFYLRSTKPLNKKGTYALWGLVVFLIVVHLMNLSGPPPENPVAIGIAGLSMWLLVAWGYWIDRNRTTN